MTYRDADRRIDELLESRAPVGAGMTSLLDLCTGAEPDSVWEDLRDLDFEADFADLSSWLEQVFTDEPPGDRINALWFGLFNPILDDDEPTCCLYICGSQRFDPKVRGFEWACNPEYFPEERYADSDALTTMYRTLATKETGVFRRGEYTLCLGYAALCVSQWCHGPMRTTLLGIATMRGVAVGFDAGGGLLIDVLGKG